MTKIINHLSFLTLSVLLFSCNLTVRHDIDPKTLVTKLRKDNLFFAFEGYGVRPRDERSGIYLIDRGKDLGVYHWVKYNPSGTKFLEFYRTYTNKDSIEITLTEADSLEILNKAHELIGILKKCDLRWAGCEFGRFDCSFNDSTRMTYFRNKDEIFPSIYKDFKNIRWIDSNFVTYE